MWQSFLKSYGRWYRPSQGCLLCHDSIESLHLCQDCLPYLQSLKQGKNVCPLCAHNSDAGAVCGLCQQQAPDFDQLWASYRLAFPLHKIIWEYKFKQQWSYAAILAAWMRDNAPPWLNERQFDAVIAMPLSRRRLFERGYNQCQLLRQFLNIQTSLIYSDSASIPIKRHYRPPQSSLSMQQRWFNANDVFCVQNDVNERHLLLIDDVVTTGATLSSLARELKGAGAASVSCWVLAKA